MPYDSDFAITKLELRVELRVRVRPGRGKKHARPQWEIADYVSRVNELRKKLGLLIGGTATTVDECAEIPGGVDQERLRKNVSAREGTGTGMGPPAGTPGGRRPRPQ